MLFGTATSHCPLLYFAVGQSSTGFHRAHCPIHFAASTHFAGSLSLREKTSLKNGSCKVSVIMDYRVRIRQQPTKGKPCGLDGIPKYSYLYPGLVIALEYPTPQPKYSMINTRIVLQQKMFVCIVSLLQHDSQHDISCISPYGLKLPKALNEYRETLKISALAGECTSAGIVLNDPEDGLAKIFFTFPDLSSRIIGTYQLKCIVVDIQQYILNSFIGILFHRRY